MTSCIINDVDRGAEKYPSDESDGGISVKGADGGEYRDRGEGGEGEEGAISNH
jgi:hypothetical protein